MLATLPRHWLYFVSGVVWTVAGLILCSRAVEWLLILPLSTGTTLGTTAGLIAVAGYYFGFAKIVKRNIRRIQGLPDRSPFYAFTAPRGYVLIALMMTSGITLRNSSLPKVYLTIPYLAMGGVLLIGCVRFYYEFLTGEGSVKEKKS